MTVTRHISMTTSEPTTLHEAIGFVLEQLDEDGPLHGADMPSISISQRMQPAAQDADWTPIWEVSVMGSFPQVSPKGAVT